MDSNDTRGWNLRDAIGTPWLWLIAGVVVAGLAAGGWILLRQGGPSVDRTWLQMQERGTWRVGMDPSFPPFESLDAQGAPVGYDVDLARALAAVWGLEAEIVAIGYDSLLDALRVDRVDAVVSAFPFDSRMTKEIHYSPPYFEAGVRLVVGADSAIESVEELAGRAVAVEWGSRGDALLLDGVSLRLAQGEGKPVRAVGPALDADPYVIAVSIKAHRLQAALYEALAALEQEQELEMLEDRWFGELTREE